MKQGVCEGISAGMDPCLSQCERCAEKYGPAREIPETLYHGTSAAGLDGKIRLKQYVWVREQK